MLRRNGPVVKSVESVLRLEGSLWGGEMCGRDIGYRVSICLAVSCIDRQTFDGRTLWTTLRYN